MRARPALVALIAVTLCCAAPVLDGSAIATAVSSGAAERLLDLLSSEQAEAFAAGADPEELILDDGRSLAEHLEELAGTGAGSLIFVPVDSCSLLRTTQAVDGKMAADEIRPFLARGETTDLSDQGGHAGGCGIPDAAVAVMMSVTAEQPDGSGRLKGWPVDAPQPGGDLLVYRPTTDGIAFFSLAVVGLCDLSVGPCATGDFNFRAVSNGTHVRAEAAGFYVPAISEVAAGDGLLGGGTEGVVTLDVDPTAVQNRVTGTCPAGSAIAEVAEDGTVVCEADDDTLAALSCAAEQIAKWDGAAWVCADDETGDVTDIWVDEAGDTMTGPLVMSTGGGTAIESHGSIDLVGSDLLKGGELLLHTPVDSVGVGIRALANAQGIGNTAVGEDALTSNSGGNNTAVGNDALRANTIGGDNTAIGVQAMYNNTEGQRNAALGVNALRGSTTGNANTAIGVDAMYSTTTGQNNTAVGEQALFANTTGESNVVVGQGAMGYNTTGSFNIAVGQSALRQNDGGSGNVAVGTGALASNTTGGSNVAVGGYALGNNTYGSENTAHGYKALFGNVNGYENTAVGHEALRDTNNGFRNTAVGYGALASNSTGGNNTALGHVALGSSVDGFFNTGIGRGALFFNTSGSHNVALGNEAGRDATTGDFNIFLGDNVYGVAGESYTTRIGRSQSQVFVSGIYGTPLGAIGEETPEGTVEVVVVNGSGQLGTASGAIGDADTLDGLDSAQFLRSDTSDGFDSGILTTAVGTTLDVDGALDTGGATSLSLPPTGISGAGSGSGLDADLLDGLDSSAFLTAGTDNWVDETGDTMTGALGLPTDGLIVNTDELVVANGGRVGIGTDSPQKDLHVNAAVGALFTLPSVASPSTLPFFAIETDLYSSGSGILSVVDRRQQTLASATPTLLVENSSGATDGSNYLIQARAAGATRFVVRQDGNVGIGVSAPAVRLDVASVMRSVPTDSPGACGASVEGALYYDASMKEPCFCNGSDWLQFDGGGSCA